MQDVKASSESFDFTRAITSLADGYSTWLLLTVVLFTAKVGEDAQEIGFNRLRALLPAYGHPNQVLICDAGDISCALHYFAWNVPLAAVFIIQHSVLRKPLQRFCGSQGRRVYSFTSALCLHFFMAVYKDLHIENLSLDLWQLGISSWHHFCISSAIIVVSFAFFMAHQGGSWFKTILFEGKKEAGGCPVNMDVITGMGICVYKELGWLGFLLFSGLSIIPRRITMGDVFMRLCAGVYLRSMSGHFQQAAGHYRSHWLARGLVIGACAIATLGRDFWSSVQFWRLLLVAAAATMVIRSSEGWRGKLYSRR